MRLTIEEHPERLQRFAHLKPASGFGGKRCGDPCPESSHKCTRERDHRGPHASHGTFGKLTAVWEGPPRPSATARTSASEARRDRYAVGEARRERGELKASSGGGRLQASGSDQMDAGALARVWARALRLFSSPEELALILLFLGLAAWGVSVAWQIVTRW